MSTPRSSVVIAKLLGSEGFSDHVANMVEKYWLRTILRGRGKARNLEKAFSEQVVPKLNDGDKLILGKFISLHKKMSFDVGIRIGLTAFSQKGDFVAAPMEAELARLRTELEEQRDIIAGLKANKRFTPPALVRGDEGP